MEKKQAGAILLTLSLSACAGGSRPDPAATYISQVQARSRAASADSQASLALRQLNKGVSPELQRQTKTYLGEKLLDGETARYRFDFTSIETGSVAVCGAVNAKNQMGGYVGFKLFYVEFVDGKPVSSATVPLVDPVTRRRMSLVCGANDGNEPPHYTSEPA